MNSRLDASGENLFSAAAVFATLGASVRLLGRPAVENAVRPAVEKRSSSRIYIRLEISNTAGWTGQDTDMTSHEPRLRSSPRSSGKPHTSKFRLLIVVPSISTSWCGCLSDGEQFAFQLPHKVASSSPNCVFLTHRPGRPLAARAVRVVNSPRHDAGRCRRPTQMRKSDR